MKGKQVTITARPGTMLSTVISARISIDRVAREPSLPRSTDKDCAKAGEAARDRSAQQGKDAPHSPPRRLATSVRRTASWPA